MHKEACVGCWHLTEIHDSDGCQFAAGCACSLTPDEIAFVRAHRKSES